MFNGFTPKTIEFLKNLETNNNKEWFEMNRSAYNSDLLHPFKELVSFLTPTMYSIDKGFELRPHKVISRIYRDIRFSKNKDPYKTCLWLTFQRPTPNWENYPGYFMELTPYSYTYGMGLYMAKKKMMDNFRDNIIHNQKEFKLKTQLIISDVGFKIEGEDYKRKLENELPEYFQPWMQKKSLWLQKTKPIGKELYSNVFAEKIKDDFISLEWLYNFLKESCPENE